MPFKDAEKARESRRKWYASNSGRQKEYRRKRDTELVVWLRELKASLICCECGEDDADCLDFHHKDPTIKDMAVSQAVNQGWGKARIIAEIEKCLILCANCHRKLHAREAREQKYAPMV